MCVFLLFVLLFVLFVLLLLFVPIPGPAPRPHQPHCGYHCNADVCCVASFWLLVYWSQPDNLVLRVGHTHVRAGALARAHIAAKTPLTKHERNNLNSVDFNIIIYTPREKCCNIDNTLLNPTHIYTHPSSSSIHSSQPPPWQMRPPGAWT